MRISCTWCRSGVPVFRRRSNTSKVFSRRGGWDCTVVVAMKPCPHCGASFKDLVKCRLGLRQTTYRPKAMKTICSSCSDAGMSPGDHACHSRHVITSTRSAKHRHDLSIISSFSVKFDTRLKRLVLTPPQHLQRCAHTNSRALVDLRSQNASFDRQTSNYLYQKQQSHMMSLSEEGADQEYIGMDFLPEATPMGLIDTSVTDQFEPQENQYSDENSPENQSLDQEIVSGEDPQGQLLEKQSYTRPSAMEINDEPSRNGFKKSHHYNPQHDTEDPFERVQAIALQDHVERCVRYPSVIIMVDRQDVWDSSINFFCTVAVANSANSLMVVFEDGKGHREAVVDADSSRKEYLNLLLDVIITDSKMVHGNEHGLCIRPSQSLLDQGYFRVLGVMLATIIAQGGQGAAIFARPVADAILGVNTCASLEHVPYPHIRDALSKVQSAETEGELHEALKICEWRASIDTLPSHVTMATRAEFVKGCIQHFVLFSSKPMLNQLTEGLQHCGILEVIRKWNLCHLLEYIPGMSPTSQRLTALLPRRTTDTGQQQIRTLHDYIRAREDGTLSDVRKGPPRGTPFHSKVYHSLPPLHIVETAASVVSGSTSVQLFSMIMSLFIQVITCIWLLNDPCIGHMN
ncbi:uncharacterized protein LOC124133246 [Haliotis rufescens]|uniref:uncharacterized protein LOC124133246 n=1 Tax=Haliotis rufescens TaxID=6454 RepID=UPI00201F0611|nr:uncharacterized protein LOC124133246 [Haliotis rufescens]